MDGWGDGWMDMYTMVRGEVGTFRISMQGGVGAGVEMLGF